MNEDRIVAAGTGRRFRVGPNELTVKAGPETGHTLATVFESTLPPGGGYPVPHVHDEYEEVFYVLEGEIEYRIGEHWTAVPAGTTVCVPPARSTPSATPARTRRDTSPCTHQRPR